MDDFANIIGQLSLTGPKLSELTTQSFIDKWCFAAMRTLGVSTGSKSPSIILVTDGGIRRFIDMRRLDDASPDTIYSAVKSMNPEYLSIIDGAICVVQEPTKEKHEWIVIYSGVELPGEILSHKVEKSNTGFMFMHMERMRRIAYKYYGTMTMNEKIITVTNNGQLFAKLWLSNTPETSSEVSTNQVTKHYNVQGSASMSIQSMICHVFTMQSDVTESMYRLWASHSTN